MKMKDQKKAKETAEGRMKMIAPLLAPNLGLADMAKLKKELCETYEVSARTLERYLRNYAVGGFEGLMPSGKATKSKYKISDELLEEAIRLRLELPSRSIPTIIQILEMEGKAPPGFLKRTTL